MRALKDQVRALEREVRALEREVRALERGSGEVFFRRNFFRRLTASLGDHNLRRGSDNVVIKVIKYAFKVGDAKAKMM